MLSHKKPTFSYSFNLATELKALSDHRKLRKVPAPTSKNVLIATWNLTNFGVQQRKQPHFALMADIIRPFDVVAVQEIADRLDHLDALLAELGAGWQCIYSDPAGNDERLAYIFQSNRVQPTGLAAELAMRGYEEAKITIQGIDPGAVPFTGFNRNPYILGFRAGKFEFSIVNVHLYWSHVGIRRLETKALGTWAKSRVKSVGPPNNDIILIGDFNLPHLKPGDVIFDELDKFGLTLPKHTTDLTGTSLSGENDYDEIAFFPSQTKKDFSGNMGVFDFDNVLFRTLYDPTVSSTKNEKFFEFVRYYVADHRLLWAEFARS